MGGRSNLAFRHRGLALSRSIGPLAVLPWVVILLALAAPAQAAFPGANGKIAFESSNGIEVVNPDWTGHAILPGGGRDPAWSPNGLKIAFTRDVVGNAEIFVANADGSGQTQLTINPANDYGPTWSPDGSKIAFTSTRSPFGIYVMNVDGSNPTHLSGLGSEPEWSPDGTKIAFVTFVGSGEFIHTMNPDGSGAAQVSHQGSGDFDCLPYEGSDQWPDWSPDSQKIIFAHSDLDVECEFVETEIRTVNRDGTGQQHFLGGFDSNTGSAAWSPDGRQVVWVPPSGCFCLAIQDLFGPGYSESPGYSPDGEIDWQSLRPPGYARPKGAQPTQVTLVPAYKPCTSPNASHGAPLDSASCSPPVQASDYLTVGTPDANGAVANSNGLVTFRSICNPPAPHPVGLCTDPGEQADAELTASLTDVRNKAGLTDYAGELRMATSIRITDRFNGAGGVHPATATDTPFGFTFACLPTSDGSIGSTCSAQTTADAVLPGIVLEDKRAVWMLGKVEVYDGGADGDTDTAGDNTVFAEQGLFVP
jgi:Tol biopolymer transport system component